MSRIDNVTGRQEYGRTFRLGQTEVCVDASARLRTSRTLGRLHLSVFMQEFDNKTALVGSDVEPWKPQIEQFDSYELRPVRPGTEVCIGSQILSKSMRQCGIDEDSIEQSTFGVAPEHMLIALDPSTAYPNVWVTDISRQGISVVPE